MIILRNRFRFFLVEVFAILFLKKDDRDRSLNKLEMKLALDHFYMSKIRGKLIFTNFQECDSSNQQEKEEYEKDVKQLATYFVEVDKERRRKWKGECLF